MESLACVPTLLEACEGGLAWVEAIELDDGSADYDQVYWHWVALMRAAIAQAHG